MEQKMKRQNSATYVAILALVVSAISLWVSYQNREYDHLVAYEQRRQEVRQLFTEGGLLYEQLERSILEGVKTEKTPDRREEAAMIWKDATELRGELESIVARFETIPATSGTEARLALEKMFAEQVNNNKKARRALEKAKKAWGIPGAPIG